MTVKRLIKKNQVIVAALADDRGGRVSELFGEAVFG